MLYFFTPYSFNNKLLDAYDHYISLLPNDTDWACFTDGDVMFLNSDFGHRIADYIRLYPETGLFTAYASRCFYPYQVPPQTDQNNASIKYHHQTASLMLKHHHGSVIEINKRIAGHLLVIQKKTWLLIREKVFDIAQHETIEGIDTAISNTIVEAGLKILLMKGMYVMHYFRMMEGVKSKKHLGYHDHLNIITPCTRAQNLPIISQSINIPRASYTWWIVFDAEPGSIPHHLIPKNARALYHHNSKSVVGHAQRNYALQFIDDGLVYFLDDDTTLHPDLYAETCTHDMQHDFIHFDQQNPDGTKRIGGKVEVNHIDTGSAVVSRQLIGNTRFRTDLYNADGYFWKTIVQKATHPRYIPKALSTYNALVPTNNDE
mgnify:CR=1 FL=1